MGWGDEILVTGEARRLQEARGTDRKVAVLDRNGRPRWSPLWEGSPRIATPDEAVRRKCLELVNGPGCRPYIDYPRMRADFARVFPGNEFRLKRQHPQLPYRFTDHRCSKGEFYNIKPVTNGYVVIEPHNKANQYNRDWGWARWQQVVDALPGLSWMQINPPGHRLLRGAVHKPAGSFLDACRMLAGARLYVGPEGGLYHAAGRRAVPCGGGARYTGGRHLRRLGLASQSGL
jgi:hypothetical protein